MAKLARAAHVARKLGYGARKVGLVPTAVGAARLLRLVVLRPARGRVSTPGGATFSFSFPSQLIPTLVVLGDLVEPELALVPRLLGPGRVAVDVGASIGTWTVLAARTGARVHACEPDADNLRTLAGNVERNGVSPQVVVHALAMGASEQLGRLERQERRYLNRVHPAEDVAPGDSTSGDLRITTLDRFADELGLAEIDLLKVNTAGGEADVVRGAGRLLRERRVGVALFLDSLSVRPLLLEARSAGYDLGVWDEARHQLDVVDGDRGLDAPRPTPMNHYLVLWRREADGKDPRPVVGV